LCEYLGAAGIRPDATLATALLYGIRSDTHDLGREATKADIEAYLSLYPLANKRALARIQRGSVAPGYFRALVDALQSARCYGSSMAADLGQTDNPDMIGEVADLLLRKEGAEWSICYGFHGQRALFSVRSSDPAADCATIARRIVGRNGSGGGHGAMAGGQIPLVQNDVAERKHVADLVLQRFLRLVGAGNQPAEKLIP
jgi:nanoRNase/pAp phosphatase (c-di-AMP/oligoRNAs hydrolase)